MELKTEIEDKTEHTLNTEHTTEQKHTLHTSFTPTSEERCSWRMGTGSGWCGRIGTRRKQAEKCLIHDLHRLRLVVAHVDVGLVDAQRAAREGRAELSEEGVGGEVGSEV